MLTQPRTDKYSLSIEDDKVRVGASSMQGWRNSMEDAHTIHLELSGMPKLEDDQGALFAVFDGHCGAKVARTCAGSIASWLVACDAFKNGKYVEALTASFLKGDKEMTALPEEQSGATGNMVLLVAHTLYCANAGDSRSVLCRGGKAFPLSEDHKPTNPEELDRIKKAGGFVSLQGRIYGVLALSRAFGDYVFKQNQNLPPEKQVVTAFPDVKKIDLQQDDEFIVLACDGIWDCMTNEDVIAFARNEIADHGDVSLACEKLMDNCLSKQLSPIGCDNMTVIIVQFKSDFILGIR